MDSLVLMASATASAVFAEPVLAAAVCRPSQQQPVRTNACRGGLHPCKACLGPFLILFGEFSSSGVVTCLVVHWKFAAEKSIYALKLLHNCGRVCSNDSELFGKKWG